MSKGLIHVYCGDGKGKTTAAAGLSIRAAGCGMKVVFLQFLKAMESGEIEILRKIDLITVIRNEKDYGFFNRMTEEDKLAITELHNKNLKAALDMVEREHCDMLVLDEVCAAYNYNLLDRGLVEKLVKEKRDDLELVLTGREPAPVFLEYADYVSEIRKIKHPYDRKITARRGIEY
ncbi:cob(I)yrinic acid a,c-diamide adenosyltransferase [Anaerocolumna xylanovorans]|uniref:Cob(I)yrinic acid a,c-diamide adenosyltransferase n=1 Tax=Anaerocolumna xylanovorans DSM 12503 TaxID=1121345 RepID=A0A1M7YL44_9FIRM|nr:cob(I)yrinic acid a,c-diamide adenosyltransferase [Anaerocolumna xylanovorans]SHO53353.1 cob(I)yrinic acid a,c-diamide adenosyltransferase [Anaerocolumna xylanovorans DSM 12503]